MKNVFAIKIATVFAACAALHAGADARRLVVDDAPFPLTVEEWIPPERDFPITAYGAKPDGSPVTEAIESAVRTAYRAGGGRVVVPAGKWLSGAFWLKSNVALVIARGATLYFPDDPVIVMRAPMKPDGRCTMTHRSLIGATGCTNVAVVGEGVIKSDVAYWHDNYMSNPKRTWPRPQVFHFERCGNVRLEGFKIRGSPAWTMHFLVCEDIVIRGVDSICTGPNTDGIDLESCNRALVENCSLDQTDDAYTIKSGMNEVGRRRNVPTQNVVIRNCRAVHGHTLLAVGSEVSGGIQNVCMRDCSVEAECIRFLYVKTNPRRGGYVKDVWMENIRGMAAGKSVFETEMFYDKNANKELTVKGGVSLPTHIENIHVKNITCADAGFAVKVNGDTELPPKCLSAKNIRVGRIRNRLVEAKSAPELQIADVRIEPALVREMANVPPQVRLCDPVRDAASSVAFDRAELEAFSGNEINQRVLEKRIAAEVSTGHNVAPCVNPRELPVPSRSFNGLFSGWIDSILRDTGCAVPGAWIADDVCRIVRVGTDGRVTACPGVTFTIAPDCETSEITVRLVNGGKVPLKDIWCVVHLPPEWMSRRHVFRADCVVPGGVFEKTFPAGAGAHYMPRPVGSALYAASIDFSGAGERTRIWATTETPPCPRYPNMNEAVRHAGPMDVSMADDKTLLHISSERGALPPLGGDGDVAAWRSPAFRGAAWYNASPPPRKYTSEERRLVDSGRACEVVAMQFEVPTNTTSVMRTTLTLWTKDAVAFLNGTIIPIRTKIIQLPANAGFNRLVIRYPSKPGRHTGLMQMSIYPWEATTCWPCLPFSGIEEQSPVRVVE